MNTREQFGNYLLLKKLGEDPLGEAFRAGKVGGHGMEEVVLLRVFNGPGIDGPGMWQRIDGRQALQKALTSPNIGSGVDLGAIRNIPYVAYDYLSGKNLASLLEQANKRAHPIPSDQALLITERIALGLAVGYETRFESGRVLHGCVLPHLVMISNEGETRLLGFEVAPGLREAIRQNPNHALGRYLSPEARAGQPTDKADDVFSLGVILLELFLGKPVPADADYAALIAGATMQPDGQPVPEDLKQLMGRSLAAKDQRIADVIQWHKTLSKLMFDGQYSPTTFNLAFYMHNLFRDEIEKESKEIEVERTMEIPVSSLPSVTAATQAPSGSGPAVAPHGDLRDSTGVREDTGVIMDRYSDEGQKSGPNKAVLGAIAAVLMVAIGAVAYMMMGRGGDETPPDPITTTAPEPAPVEPVGPTPEELEAQQLAEAAAAAEEQAALEAQIASIVDAKTKEREAELEQLKSDLAAAKQRESDAAKERERLAAVAAQQEQAAAEQAAAEQAAAEQAAAEQAAAKQAAAEEAARLAEAKPPAEVKPKAPDVKTGDLVTLAPGVVPPKYISMRQVTYPAMARRLRKESTVTVSCLIDEDGNVVDTRLKGKEVGFGMDSEALAAAKTARFNPATKNGVRVKIWWDVPIKFQL
ncbi:MAG: TonB family protein [Thermoanaerobaculia bacterium]|nr:TonB family protein [Thermoanaerobaculia bacterium]